MYSMLELLKGMKPRDLSRTLTNATDFIAPDNLTKRKILAGIVVGAAALGTLWAIRAYQESSIREPFSFDED